MISNIRLFILLSVFSFVSQNAFSYDRSGVSKGLGRAHGEIESPAESQEHLRSFIKKIYPWVLAGGAVVGAIVLVYVLLKEKDKLDAYKQGKEEMLQTEWYEKRIERELAQWKKKESDHLEKEMQGEVEKTKKKYDEKLNLIIGNMVVYYNRGDARRLIED
jgi:hypothetical protein